MIYFLKQIIKIIFTGNRLYKAWMIFLSVFFLCGLLAYFYQLKHGLIITWMRDPVSWGLYIGNFTFLVGVAAAAVLLVIPAYLYNFKPIKEIVLFGEMIAMTALTLCLMFIIVDLGRPGVAWHIMPFIGRMNFPSSLLAWDTLVLNLYLLINTVVVFYILYCLYRGKEYSMRIVMPLVVLSIPCAVGIHTVTAFLYNGLVARPFWNASILAPRFLASALCSGPALMIIIFQIVRKLSRFDISDKAIYKISELMAYAIGFNLFLFAAEIFKEFYSGSIHLAPLKYLYFGLHDKIGFVPWMWSALIFNMAAFFIFLVPRFREKLPVLNIGCILIFTGVFIEKGMGLIIPGFVPSSLGEIYEYYPSFYEIAITVGIWSFGGLFYTILLKIGLNIYDGKLRSKNA
ncbi:sulfate reduction electron transfer complex DsrMKJOP subunit DsrP [Spirochaetota bacterium]